MMLNYMIEEFLVFFLMQQQMIKKKGKISYSIIQKLNRAYSTWKQGTEHAAYKVY